MWVNKWAERVGRDDGLSGGGEAYDKKADGRDRGDLQIRLQVEASQLFLRVGRGMPRSASVSALPLPPHVGLVSPALC